MCIRDSPDVERGAPVAVAADAPVLHVFQPVAEAALADAVGLSLIHILREVTVQPGTAVNPTDGQQIMELDTLQLQLTAPGLLRVSITGAYGQQGATSVCFARGEAAV